MKMPFILIMYTVLMSCNCQTKQSNVPQEVKNIKVIGIVQKDYGMNIAANNGFVKDIPFFTELLSKLNDPKDTIYIIPRSLMEKFNTIEISDSVVIFKYKKQYEVTIKKRQFNPKSHSLDLVDSTYKNRNKVDYGVVKNIIDGRKAYGIDGDIPKTEVSKIVININNQNINIPNKYFNDIFNVNLEGTEVFLSSESDLIFIYINGSDGAGSYSAKYVINGDGYVTRIITNLCGFDFLDGIKYDCV